MNDSKASAAKSESDAEIAGKAGPAPGRAPQEVANSGLSDEQLDGITGGVNPQPLPPQRD